MIVSATAKSKLEALKTYLKSNGVLTYKDNDPKYNPWGMGGTIVQIWNPKMPELPYLVTWDTGYKNSYAKENLTKI